MPYKQTKFLPINFSDQILPGTFEYTLNYLIDQQLDLSVFDSRYKNDDGGRPAYDPSILLKVILAAYSRGITSSRKIERLCRENIIFITLSADSQPHFTTLAGFISQMSDVIEPLFLEVLLICDDAGLIGNDMFAIDGCKMPSNASREWSGTHSDLTKKHKKIDRAVRRILKKHREEDETGLEEIDRRSQEVQQIETLRAASKKIKKHLVTMPEKIGSRGNPLKGNITDNESARMKTSKGVIQGYNGVAAVDRQHQIIIAAEAFGQGSEHDLLEPIVEQVKDDLGIPFLKSTKLTADSGFHNKNNLGYCQDEQLSACIADGNFRKRDPRFKERDRHQPVERKKKYFIASAFYYDVASETCQCPMGNEMWKRGERTLDGYRYANFGGYLKDCRECPMQKRCMRHPVKENGRQVSIKIGKDAAVELSLIDKMKKKIDSDRGRHIYSQRLGCVEPVFGNINTAKRVTIQHKFPNHPSVSE